MTRAQRQSGKLRAAELRRLVKRLRSAKRRLLRLAATDCRRMRERARHERKGLGRQIDTAKAAAHCATGRGVALSQFSAHFGKLAREIMAIRAAAARTVDPKRRARGRELKAERESLLEHDVPPELLPAWRKYRHKFKAVKAPDGRIRTSAVEKFKDWAEENPDVVYELVSEDADHWLTEITNQYNEAHADTAVTVYVDGRQAA